MIFSGKVDIGMAQLISKDEPSGPPGSSLGVKKLTL